MILYLHALPCEFPAEAIANVALLWCVGPSLPAVAWVTSGFSPVMTHCSIFSYYPNREIPAMVAVALPSVLQVPAPGIELASR